MHDLDRLLAERDVQQLILAAAAAVDAQDVAALADLFTDDAVLVRPGASPLEGREAIRQAYAARPADRITRHLVTNTRVAWPSADQASAHSLVLLWSGDRGDADGPQGRPAQGRQLVGEFDDTLVRGNDGRWRIARRVARFVLHREG